MESWRLGGLESLRAGDLESGKAGELESMRPGELETLSKDSLARIPQPGIFKKICLGSPLESFVQCLDFVGPWENGLGWPQMGKGSDIDLDF